MTRTDVPDFSRAVGGCLPVIAQDVETGDVLMLAYMNAEAFRLTLEGGQAVYFSRSRQRLWLKGEQSGHTQQVMEILVDCDADTILIKVRQEGVACHEGYRSCFFRQMTPDGIRVVLSREVDPATVYRRDDGQASREVVERAATVDCAPCAHRSSDT